MKRTYRLFAFLLAALLLLSVAPLSFAAGETSGQCGDNVFWQFDEATGTLTISGTGDMWDYNVMEEPLTFPTYSDLGGRVKEVVIASGVTSVGAGAFVCGLADRASGTPESSVLTAVTIPGTVTKIGEAAFSNCYYLQEIVVPDSVKTIGDNAFEHCKSLQTLTLPQGLTSFGRNVVVGCTHLQSFTVPDCMTEVYIGDFYGCSSLSSILLPAQVTAIGVGAFLMCDALRDLYILNPDCEICETFGQDLDELQGASDAELAAATVPEGVTIHAPANSKAKTFAQTYHYAYALYDPSHIHNYQCEVIPANCTAPETLIFVCSCGDSYTETNGEPLGHNWQEVQRQNPTVTENGYVIRNCTRCGNDERIVLTPEDLLYVTITVKDDRGSALSGASVRVYDGSALFSSTVSDGNGQAYFPVPEAKEYRVEISCNGFKNASGSIVVDENAQVIGGTIPALTRGVNDPGSGGNSGGSGSCNCTCHKNGLWPAIYRMFHKLIKLFLGEYRCCADANY